MNLEISDVDCECDFAFNEHAELKETEVLMNTVDAIESVISPQLAISVTDAENLTEIVSPDSRTRKRQRKKPRRLEPRLNVIREKSPFGKF